MNQQDSLKQLVGQTAAKLVKNGMIVGLGTGSTVRFLVDALGKRVQEEGLAITGVTTSNRTTAQATSLGIKIVDLDDVDPLWLVTLVLKLRKDLACTKRDHFHRDPEGANPVNHLGLVNNPHVIG